MVRRWSLPSATGLPGLTMSEEGGFEEVDESLCAAANCFLSCWTSSSKCPRRCCNASFACWSFVHREQGTADRCFIVAIIDGSGAAGQRARERLQVRESLHACIHLIRKISQLL